MSLENLLYCAEIDTNRLACTFGQAPTPTWNMLQLLSWEMRLRIIYWKEEIFLLSLQKNSIFGEKEDYQGAN